MEKRHESTFYILSLSPCMVALANYTNATHVYTTPSPRVGVVKDNLVDAVLSGGVCAKHRSCMSVHPEHRQNGYYLVLRALLLCGFIGLLCGHLCGFKQYTCRESVSLLTVTAPLTHQLQYMNDSTLLQCVHPVLREVSLLHKVFCGHLTIVCPLS